MKRHKRKIFSPRHGKKGYSTVAFGFRSKQKANEVAQKMDNSYVFKKKGKYGIRCRK